MINGYHNSDDAIFIGSSATLNMYAGAKVIGNGAVSTSGIRLRGTFNMYNGQIAGNYRTSPTYSSAGGGVRMEGGSDTSPVFNMYGGRIEDNMADNGGGVYIWKEGKFNVSGDAKVSSNTAKGAANNVDLTNDNSVVTITGPLSKAEFGITANGNIPFTSGWSSFGGDDPKEFFRADAEDKFVALREDGEAELRTGYQVNFEKNGGQFVSGYTPIDSYDGTRDIPLPGADNITRTGYTFSGWYENKDFTGQPCTMIATGSTGQKTYYAKWTVNKYSVKLELNGGKLADGVSDTFEYTYGVSATLPTEKEITRGGYSFGGWYDNEKLEGNPVKEITTTDIGNKEYWAKWTRISTTTYYDIILEDTTHGTVEPSRRSASLGTTVTLTITADDHCKLASLTVTDSNGNNIVLTDEGDGKFTFKMPASKVTVKAVFAPDALPFKDVLEDAWYYDGVWYAYTQGLMDGISSDLFAPDSTTTRAMIATILWRKAGEPVVNYAMDYTDVPEGEWYSEAIRWATSEGVVTGYGNNLFGTNDPITREQFAAMLWRFAKKQGYDVSIGENTNILSYTDVADVAEYAIPAMQWAVGTGVINGITDSTLSPQGESTRAQVAVMLMRFSEYYADGE